MKILFFLSVLFAFNASGFAHAHEADALDSEGIVTLYYDEANDGMVAKVPGVEELQNVEPTQIAYKKTKAKSGFGYHYEWSCIWYLGYGGARECYRVKVETIPNWPYCDQPHKPGKCFVNPLPGTQSGL
jgi:hypothetical protein